MSVWDDDCGYDLNDPKHPTYADRVCDYADLFRKYERVDAPEASEEEAA